MTAAERDGWHQVLLELEELGIATHVDGRGWCSPRREGWLVGTLRVQRKGGGIVRAARVEEAPQTYIPRAKMKDGRAGDLVLIKRRKPRRDIGKPRGKRRGKAPAKSSSRASDELPEGRLLRVIRRSRRVFLGKYVALPQGGVVEPMEERSREVYIPHEVSQGADFAGGELRDGDRVLARCIDGPTVDGMALGEVIDRAAELGTWKADLQWVVASFDLPEAFPDEVVKEAESFPSQIPESWWQGRRDVRDWPIVTIDPTDAKDYDDGVCLEKRPDGGWSLRVFVADVSAFVTPGSALDREAFRRGTSVYLPGLVIPMLPERLSNELCSLNQGQETLAKGVFIELDPSGGLESCRAERVVMRSARRYSYQEAQELLEGAAPDAGEESLASMLRDMNQLRQLRLQKRRERGALDLDLPEQRLILDEDGEVVEIEKGERLDAHRLVEEFMLLANESVARIATERGIEILRRVHPAPPDDDVETFAKFCRVLFPEVTVRSARDFPQLVAALSGSSQVGGSDAGGTQEAIVSLALLRALTRAEYSPIAAEHFALALDEYCHFTSPIRRYPDLQVHQALDRWLFGVTPSGGKRGPGVPLEQVATSCSETERHAEEAEREMKKLRTISWLHPLEGELFGGIVTAVFDFGFFVRADDTLVEGMVHLSSMRDDFYVHDEKSYSLRGRNTGRAICLGDRVEVRLDRADSVERVIDFSYKRHLPVASTNRRR